MDPFYKNYFNTIYSRLKILLRIALAVTLVINVFTLVYILTLQHIGTILYLPIYGFMFGQVPAALFLTFVCIYRMVNRQPVRASIKIELWLLILTLLTTVLIHMSVVSIEGP